MNAGNHRFYLPDGRERLERYQSLMRENTQEEEEEEDGEYEDFPQVRILFST